MNDHPTEPPVRPSTRTSRAVHRAIGELRRGTGVLLTDDRPALVLAAETASVAAMLEAGLVAGAGGPVRLVVSSGRLPEAGETELVGFEIATSLAELARRAKSWLRDLADPSRQNPLIDLAVSFERAPLPATAQAAVALVKLARLSPAALLVETDEGGIEQAGLTGMDSVDGEAVLAFARETGLALEIVAEAPVPLDEAADARMVAFRAPDGGIEHLAVVIGDPGARDAPLVRLHSECFTGDFLGSLRCDCGDQLRGAIRRMREDGAGILLYLAQEGRGIGLVNKLRAYSLQDRGLDTLDANRALGWEADERSFLIAATMLRRLGVGRVRLLTNNPAKVEALTGFGIEVVERVGHVVAPNGVNDAYLATKRRRFGHMIG